MYANRTCSSQSVLGFSSFFSSGICVFDSGAGCGCGCCANAGETAAAAKTAMAVTILTNVMASPLPSSLLRRDGVQTALSPCSPVRIRIASSRRDTNTLPSPIDPVLAAPAMSVTTLSTSPSGTTTSTFIFGRKSTVYSPPRYISVWPFCRPKPRTSLTVMPTTPAAVSASLTSSSLNGLMIASIFVIAASRSVTALGRHHSRHHRLRFAGDAVTTETVHQGAWTLDLGITVAAHLRHVEAFEFDLWTDPHAEGEIVGLEERVRGNKDEPETRERADDLGNELARPAVEQSAHRSLDAVEPVPVRPVGKEAHAEDAPGPARAVHGNRADRIVDLQRALDVEHGPAHEHAGDGADHERPEAGDERARSRDGHQARQHAVDQHRGIGLAVDGPHVEHRGDRAGSAGQHRVHGDDGDAQIGAGKGAARVETEPAEGEDEAAEGRHRDVVAGDRVGGAVLVVLADARAQHHRARQRGHATDHVDDGRAGEVDVAVAEAEVLAQLGEPAAAPHPVGEQRVREHRDEEAED